MKKIIVILAVVMFFIINNQEVESVVIPNSAIRVRIISNSSNSEDLAAKEKLRQELEPIIYDLLKNVTSLDEARNVLISNIPNIDVEIEKSLKKQNTGYSFETKYGLNYFPQKEFKGVIYEEGYYESLVVKLGDGSGDNWWCVLFPPLCLLEFEDEIKDDIEYRSFVMDILNKYI